MISTPVKCQKCSFEFNISIDIQKLGKKPGVKCNKCGHIQPLILDKSLYDQPEEKTKILHASEKVVFGAKLMVLGDDKTPVHTFHLKIGNNSFGRTSDALLYFNDKVTSIKESTVSKNHFVILLTKNNSVVPYKIDAIIWDNGSTNGTYLNQSKLNTDAKVYLTDGDIVTAGKVHLIFKTISY